MNNFTNLCKNEESYKNKLQNIGCVTHPHNYNLQWLVETGPLGLLLFILYISLIVKFVINKNMDCKKKDDFVEIEKQIIKILETKIKPAVAKDGGDIKFKEFKNGVVTVQLQGSCSGCPSSTMTLKQGVQNLLCHYIPDVKEVVAI